MSAPQQHPRLHKHHTLLAWPELDPLEPGKFQKPKTARQLFEELDTDNDGFVSVEDVAREWTQASGMEIAKVEEVLAKIALNAGLTRQFSWMEFRAAVRLWQATNGQPAELRPYLLQATTAASASVVTALMAMQAADMACAVGGETTWPQLAALGSIGAFISLVSLDVGSVRPILQPRKADAEAPLLLGTKTRRVLFLTTSVSGGFFFAPMVPLLASTIGDPQTKGYGPLAVAALSVTHLAGQIIALALRPAKWLPATLSTPMAVSISGGVAATAVGIGASIRAGREGAQRPILLSTGLLSIHSLVTMAIAMRCHSRGEPEPLHPTLAPIMHLMALVQKLFPRIDLG